jgi:hypothetical protein
MAPSNEEDNVMRTAGFPRIKNLQGGMLAWVDQVDHTMPQY